MLTVAMCFNGSRKAGCETGQTQRAGSDGTVTRSRDRARSQASGCPWDVTEQGDVRRRTRLLLVLLGSGAVTVTCRMDKYACQTTWS